MLRLEGGAWRVVALPSQKICDGTVYKSAIARKAKRPRRIERRHHRGQVAREQFLFNETRNRIPYARDICAWAYVELIDKEGKYARAGLSRGPLLIGFCDDWKHSDWAMPWDSPELRHADWTRGAPLEHLKIGKVEITDGMAPPVGHDCVNPHERYTARRGALLSGARENAERHACEQKACDAGKAAGSARRLLA